MQWAILSTLVILAGLGGYLYMSESSDITQELITLASDNVEPINEKKLDILGYDMEGRKLIEKNGVYIFVDEQEHCAWKPDGKDDGYKTCGSIVEIYNSRTQDLSIASKASLNFSIATNNIKGTKTAIKYYWSNTYNNITFDYINKKEWSDWKAVDTILPEFKSGGLYAIKMEYEIPKYESTHYDFSLVTPLGQIWIDPDVSACGTLSSANSVYTLTTDIYENGTCFLISASNITLNCQGNSIYFANNSNSTINYGINVNSVNDTVMNCNVFTTNITKSGAVGGIRVGGSGVQARIYNNNVTIFGATNSYGLWDASSANGGNFSNNRVIFTADGSGSAGSAMMGASNMLFYNNYIEVYEGGVTCYETSTSTASGQAINNYCLKNSSTAGAFLIQANNILIRNNTIISRGVYGFSIPYNRNNITINNNNITMASNSGADPIIISPAVGLMRNITVENNYIEKFSSTYHIEIGSTNHSMDLRLINNSLANYSVFFVLNTNAPNGTYNESYYMNVKSNYTNGSNAPNIQFNITSNYGTTTTYTTDADGNAHILLPYKYLRNFSRDSSVNFTYVPQYANASNGAEQVNVIFRINQTRNIVFNFSSGGADPCAYTSGNFAPPCSCTLGNIDLNNNNITLSGSGTTTITGNITNFNVARIDNQCIVRINSGGRLVT